MNTLQNATGGHASMITNVDSAPGQAKMAVSHGFERTGESFQPAQQKYTQLRQVMGKSPEISVVIPVYNEEDNIELLYSKLTASLEEMGRTWEAILIDDGSSDQSYRKLRDIAVNDSRIKVVRFVRNFGQTAALAAGIDHATGDVIIPMDADLQNDPADFKRLLEKLDEGYDVVSGWRKDRKDELLLRLPPHGQPIALSLIYPE